MEQIWAPFGQAMFDAARLQPAERVLDIGCGYGTATIEAAERVAPSGRVVGVDISAAMLEPARRRVTAAGLDNIELLEADAQAHPFDAGSFDAVISRFGTMFFADPEAAFANLARALRPGGRLAFVCWQDPLKSEWIAAVVSGIDASPAMVDIARMRVPEGDFLVGDLHSCHTPTTGSGSSPASTPSSTRLIPSRRWPKPEGWPSPPSMPPVRRLSATPSGQPSPGSARQRAASGSRQSGAM